MITKKMVELDAAARSVRRTFIGSIAGTFGMLAVVGGAGAYAMTERASAHGAAGALGSWQARLSPIIERAAPIVERAIALAGDLTRRMPFMFEPADVVVRAIPRPAPPLVAPPIASAPPVAPPIAAVEWPAVPAPPVAAAEVPPLFTPVVPPVATVEPPAMPAPADSVVAQTPAPEELPSVSVTVTVAMPAPPAEAPMAPPAEAPKVPAAPAQLEAALPPPATQPVAPPTPVEPVATADVVNAIEAPKAVWVMLPHRKPPPSPAKLLDLNGNAYDKAERCLAQAVYFEARNEPVRGQMAVAQVVLNRVFSPYYPKDVCSVVFQNAHRHLSCQFTFACDGKPEAIRERGAWARAQRIARQTLDAQIWLPEVAKATHYHAAYVRPNWIRDMKVLVRHGLHTFYRPRNWGDGSKEPGWGTSAAAESTPATTATVAHKKRKNS